MRVAAVPAGSVGATVRLGTTWRSAGWVLGASVCFHLAQTVTELSGLVLLFLWGVVGLSGLATWRRTFYATMVLGCAAYAPHLAFFWTIFGPGALALWAILAAWLGLFGVLARLVGRRLSPLGAAMLLPVLWTGVEYFRSELYYLRFSWLGTGYMFAEVPALLSLSRLGVYGLGFVLIGVVATARLLPTTARWLVLGAAILGLSASSRLAGIRPEAAVGERLSVAGVQLEGPTVAEVLGALDRMLTRWPATQLFVLSEYTFDGPVPEAVRAWCRQHRRHLIAGGTEPLSEDRFRNTAWVIGPEGEVAFQQAKSVPIQFFRDGEAATHRAVWNSPWGRLAIPTYYDLSYRRVMDDFVRQGAQALIVPTMDVAEWGEAQHRLHGRVGPVRAAEYGIPVFRVCSSGLSQWIDAGGRVRAAAGFPGQGETLRSELELGRAGRLSLDHWLAPVAAGGAALVLVGLVFAAWREVKWKGRCGPDQRSEGLGECRTDWLIVGDARRLQSNALT